MPLINRMIIGFGFHFRKKNSITKNKKNAAQFRDNKSGFALELPNSAKLTIVTAAEIIKPKEADFNPFNISST